MGIESIAQITVSYVMLTSLPSYRSNWTIEWYIYAYKKYIYTRQFPCKNNKKYYIKSIFIYLIFSCNAKKCKHKSLQVNFDLHFDHLCDVYVFVFLGFFFSSWSSSNLFHFFFCLFLVTFVAKPWTLFYQSRKWYWQKQSTRKSVI